MFGRLKSISKQYLARRLNAPNTALSLKRLKSLGFKPTLIFDVGAYQGEFMELCRNMWPNSKVICFEPLEHCVQKLRRKASCQSGKVEIFPLLVGERSDNHVLFHCAETASSILPERNKNNFPVSFYPMNTLDQIAQERFLDCIPNFVKIDVQGYEYRVLQSAKQVLEKSEVLLIELNLIDIHEGTTCAADVIHWLSTKGWSLYDICGFYRRPLDEALWQIDAIFLRTDSPYLLDKRYSSR